MTRPVIGIISVDNYDDVTGSLPDADVSKINTFVAGLFLSLLRPSIFIIDVLKVIVFTSSPTTVF